jgi:hypothetical protein
MSDEKAYTEAEAHRLFAIQFNAQTWDLLDKTERNKEEEELMVYSAHASCRHWLEAGAGVNHQRGEWMISRVYAVLGLGDSALRHAERCLELTSRWRGRTPWPAIERKPCGTWTLRRTQVRPSRPMRTRRSTLVTLTAATGVA